MLKNICLAKAVGRRCRDFSRLVSSSTTALLSEKHHVYQFPESLPPAAQAPVITSRKLQYLSEGVEPKQAWLETLSTAEDKKLGIVNLHPDVFATYPRLDILYENIRWQQMYKHVDYAFAKNRAEMAGGGRKPWRQKGTGRARHGSIRSPLWKGGGKTFGPRGPASYFFMLPRDMRAYGLRVALSVKYNQGDLHIVDSLQIPTDEPEHLRALIESRGWGLSALFVSEMDYINADFAKAIDNIKEYNVMPTYGLNVYSMMKHETLIITLPVLEKLEEKLLLQLHSQQRERSSRKRSS